VAELPSPRSGGDAVILTVACREFVELVTEYLEGTLSDELEKAITTHLELCEPCVVYLEQMRSTAAMLRTVQGPALPQPARARLLEVFTSLHGRPSDGPRP
jgi:predicted anti-sigma-YlaC factor YlaD